MGKAWVKLVPKGSTRGITCLAGHLGGEGGQQWVLGLTLGLPLQPLLLLLLLHGQLPAQLRDLVLLPLPCLLTNTGFLKILQKLNAGSSVLSITPPPRQDSI